MSLIYQKSTEHLIDMFESNFEYDKSNFIPNILHVGGLWVLFYISRERLNFGRYSVMQKGDKMS